MQENKQLVPSTLLQSSKKILFITHLQVGDFSFLQNYFNLFAQQYPGITIDLWVDEPERTRRFWHWEKLKHNALFDWLKNVSLLKNVYTQTYSPGTFKVSLKRAQQEQYDVVVSLCSSFEHRYAMLARKIAKKGFVAVRRTKTRWHNIFKKYCYKKAEAVFFDQHDKTKKDFHSTDKYASWFKQLFNLELSAQQKKPFIQIPSQWISYAKLRFLKYGIDKKHKQFGTVFFLNAFSHNKKNCWPLQSLVTLIQTIKRNDIWNDVSFFINAPVESYQEVNTFFTQRGLNNVIVFCPTHNFFQLPAIMSCCDMIISVDDSIMHLANAVGVPVVALMRQKNIASRPLDAQNSFVVTTKKRRQWVATISTHNVFEATKQFARSQ